MSTLRPAPLVTRIYAFVSRNSVRRGKFRRDRICARARKCLQHPGGTVAAALFWNPYGHGRRVLPHEAPAALCHRRSKRDAGRSTHRGAGHHRPWHGQPRSAATPARDRHAVRGRAEAVSARLFGLGRHSRRAQGAGQLLCPALRGRARSRYRSGDDDGLEGGARQPRHRDHRSGRRGAGAEPELSDPHLRLHHRRGDDPLGADHPGRALLGIAGTRDGLHRAAPVDPDRQLSVEPHGRNGRSGLLRAPGGLGQGAQGLDPLGPRLFRALL